MNSVVLSTTEAEYMALSQVVKELKFLVQVLQTMITEFGSLQAHTQWRRM